MERSAMLVIKPKISVIIPVYNAQNHLAKCIDSLIVQSYCNLEIILIDDGSTDNSPTICDSYAGKDDRIVVVHKKNAGVSEARNTGIRYSTGEYICFLDSDDFVEKDLIEDAVRNALIHQCDIVVWGFYADYLDKKGQLVKTVVYETPVNGKYSQENFKCLPLDYQFINCMGYVWNKMYDVNIIKKSHALFDRDVSIGEDLLFNSAVLAVSQSMIFLKKPYNHYVQRSNNSLGKKYYPNYIEIKMKILNALNNLLNAWEVEPAKIKRLISNFNLKVLTGTIRNISNSESYTFLQKVGLVKHVLKTREVHNLLVKTIPEKRTDRLVKFVLKHQLYPFLIFGFSLMNSVKKQTM